MSLHPQVLCPIPEETARVAHAAYPKGTLAMRLRDALGGIYRDEQFTSLFAERGRPAEAPWRLAVVLVLQFAEGIIRVVNANMEKAIRVVSIEKGYDTRDFSLVAFGGAGAWSRGCS